MDLYYGMGESANGSDLYYWEQYKHNNTHDNLINYGESTNGSNEWNGYNEWNGKERNGRINTNTVCTVFAIICNNNKQQVQYIQYQFIIYIHTQPYLLT